MLRNAPAPRTRQANLSGRSELGRRFIRSSDARGPVWSWHIRRSPAKYWMVSVFGPLLCCLLLVIWWLAASRATWRERVFGFLGLVASAASPLSSRTRPCAGRRSSYFTLPMGFFLFALTAGASQEIAACDSFGAAVLLAFAGFSVSLFLRSDGMTGDYKFVVPFALETNRGGRDARRPDAGNAKTGGANRSKLASRILWRIRNGPNFAARTAPGVRLRRKFSTNWNEHPPKLLWKIPVGPGWSSFAVAGRMLFTQDQRGPKETVVCYDADSGREIWKTEIDATPGRSDGRSRPARDADAGEWRALRRRQHRSISAAKPGHGRNRLEEGTDPGCR